MPERRHSMNIANKKYAAITTLVGSVATGLAAVLPQYAAVITAIGGAIAALVTQLAHNAESAKGGAS